MYPNAGAFRFAVILFLLLFLRPAVDATTYEWTDASGNVHFTDDLTRVPEAQRERVKTVSLPEPQAPESRPPPPPTPPEPDPEEKKAVDAYTACTENLEKTSQKLHDAHAEDQERLLELNRRIHRSSKSRIKNEMQRERAAVRARIEATEEKISKDLPRMQWECERKRPYIP